MEKTLIDIVSKTYITSKRKVLEKDSGVASLANRYKEHYRVNVEFIEYVVSCLNDDDRLIIENEVLKGKKGAWYYEYMSAPTYYRHRKKAYTNFLQSLI